MEEVKEDQVAKIEGCSHEFCIDCIKEWAFETENSCPNCKARFNKIITKTEEIKVPDKSELKVDSDSEITMFCEFLAGKVKIHRDKGLSVFPNNRVLEVVS